jgi:hypothetical protein
MSTFEPSIEEGISEPDPCEPGALKVGVPLSTAVEKALPFSEWRPFEFEKVATGIWKKAFRAPLS